MEFGPIQMLVVGFEHGKFEGEILAELERLREQEIIRLVDLLFVTKNEDGDVAIANVSDLSPEQAAQLGGVAEALVGFGADHESDGDEQARSDEEVWYVADAIPPGASAGIALLEHRWAIPLREAIERAGGVALADEWVHPADIETAGAAAAKAS